MILKSYWLTIRRITANITPSSAVGGILEEHWNGTLLNTLETTLEWAKSMTWKGLHPVVELLETVYKKGVRIAKKVFQSIADRITRHPLLPKYCVTIQPQGL
jgi:Rhodopirellula transposase DDE domain